MNRHRPEALSAVVTRALRSGCAVSGVHGPRFCPVGQPVRNCAGAGVGVGPGRTATKVDPVPGLTVAAILQSDRELADAVIRDMHARHSRFVTTWRAVAMHAGVTLG